MKENLLIAVVLLMVGGAVPGALAAESSDDDESLALAQIQEVDTVQDASTLREASFTLSTLNLLKPILSSETIEFGPELEVMAEFNVADVLGIAGLVGYGKATALNMAEPYDLHGYRAGVQAAWYPLANFDGGLQLGTQGLFRHFRTSYEEDGMSVSGTGNAFDLVGFVGYKAIFGAGFTFLAQIGGGLQFIFARGEASTDTATAEDEERGTAPAILFNLNLGWSI